MSCVQATFLSLARPPHATASHGFARTLYIMVPVGRATPSARVGGHFSDSLLRPRGPWSPLGHRAASSPRKIQSA
jgi:hypothetical protein